ncbi:hypothetical protein HW537_10980 [Asaia siamensis]
MDLKVTAVSDVRRMSGFRLYQTLDEIGLIPDVAAWVHEAEGDYWWYMIATPLIDTEGPDWVYERLLPALRKIGFPREITPLDIHIYSPNEVHISKLIRSVPFEGTSDPDHIIMSHMDDVNFGDWSLDAIVAYRVGRQKVFAASRARTFSRSVERLLAA